MGETTWVEIDPYYDGEGALDCLPSCDVVTCGYNVIESEPGPPRRMFRQVGGVDDGLRLCEKCMEPSEVPNG